jgi:hypothetical protein
MVTSLTPLDSCDNLRAQVADFGPQNSELFHVPHCFSSECRSATQKVEVAVVDSPKALPEENND